MITVDLYSVDSVTNFNHASAFFACTLAFINLGVNRTLTMN